MERRCPLNSISVPLRTLPDGESARITMPRSQSRRQPPTRRNIRVFFCVFFFLLPPTCAGEPCRNSQPPLRHPLYGSRQSLRHHNLPKAHCLRARPAVAHCGRIRFIHVILVGKSTLCTPSEVPTLYFFEYIRTPHQTHRCRHHATIARIGTPSSALPLLRPLPSAKPRREIPRSNPCRQTAGSANPRLSAKEMP